MPIVDIAVFYYESYLTDDKIVLSSSNNTAINFALNVLGAVGVTFEIVYAIINAFNTGFVGVEYIILVPLICSYTSLIVYMIAKVVLVVYLLWNVRTNMY